ncbi:MAG: DUF493 family protein [Flavobacteriia bacterium]|nr:DUF493 family protein [Flavobacteriia bacterium]
METFEGLRTQLELQEWPNVYFFKFIVPSESEKIAMVSGLFDDQSQLTIHSSKNGNYTSISIKMVMIDVDSIMAIYLKASEINGIIIL